MLLSNEKQSFHMVTENERTDARKLILTNGNTANSWQQFFSQWKNYEIATGLKKKEKEVRLATFLCVIGKEG